MTIVSWLTVLHSETGIKWFIIGKINPYYFDSGVAMYITVNYDNVDSKRQKIISNIC